MKVAGWDGPGNGTHLELESKLRACPAPWFRLFWFSGFWAFWGGLCCSEADRLFGKGRAPWGVVLATLSPEMARG